MKKKKYMNVITKASIIIYGRTKQKKKYLITNAFLLRLSKINHSFN